MRNRCTGCCCVGRWDVVVVKWWERVGYESKNEDFIDGIG
jgi:hypothetical protein